MKDNETAFSVVIPCYNAESSIERCLNSIKENYYDNVEIIIVNDNSTDKTSTILHEYIANNIGLNIIYVENEKNLGAGESRNRGIELSSCEYITFVDADDLISISFFKELNLIIRQKKYDCIIFNAVCCTLCGEKNFSMFYGGRYAGSLDIPSQDALVYVKGCTCGKAYKRQIIKENSIRFADLKRNEDSVFTKTALSCCSSVYFIDKAIYHYIENDKSLMHDASLLDKNNALNAFELIARRVGKKNLEKELNSIYLIEVVYSTTLTCIRKKENPEGNYKDVFSKYDRNDPYYGRYSLKYRVMLFLFKMKMFGLVSTLIAYKK